MFQGHQHRLARRFVVAVSLVTGWSCASAHPGASPATETHTGQWAYVARSPSGNDSMSGLLTIIHHAGGYSGTVQMGGPAADSIHVSIDWQGTHLSFAVPTRTPPSGTATQEFITVSASMQPDRSLVGEWIRDGQTGSWVATSKAGAPTSD